MAEKVRIVQRSAVAVNALLYLASFSLPAILFREVLKRQGKYVFSGKMEVYSAAI